jgi:CoA:oxalate CoA-transferase
MYWSFWDSIDEEYVAMKPGPARPLEGLVVLDLSQYAAGPYCTMMMADSGARVIKIEQPGRGDPYRHEGPELAGEDGSVTGGFFMRFNRTKESVTINLKEAEGVALVKRLTEHADVLVENFKPDFLNGCGVGYSQLSAVNPRLVYASISGFGHTDFLMSPYWSWPAFAVVAEAMGGIMDRIGDATCPPHWSGVSLGDLYAGATAFSGVLLALLQRGLNGQGQHVDISMTDSIISLNERAIFSYGVTGDLPDRGSDPALAPFGPFEAKDGWMVIGVIGTPMWQRFAHAIGRPELATDPRLATGLDRGRHMPTVIVPAIHEWLQARTRNEATRALHDANVPAAPVETAREIFRSPHAEARNMLVDVSYPGYGTHKVVASPFKLSGDPSPDIGPVPGLGEHTRAVLTTLGGVSDDEIAGLAERGVI